MKKIFGWLHRWLGLSSGLVVFIVAFTGCIYSFQAEIKSWYEDFRKVDARDTKILPPSYFQSVALQEFPERALHSVNYGQADDAVELVFYESEPEIFYHSIFCNPYSGEIIRIKDHTKDFFYQVLQGHFNLWLPVWIGKPIVATATLIFIVMMITGLILWWPKNKNARKQRFAFRWKKSTGKKRKNYDLHTILGFYALSFGLVLAWTGLVWGFAWFGAMNYAISGSQKSMQYSEPHTEVGQTDSTLNNVDELWKRITKEYPQAAKIDVHFPESDSSSLHLSINPDKYLYYRSNYRYFDQYTLEEIEVDHLWGRFEDADASDAWLRMNYDVHVGAIGGIPGKIIAFLVSLIVASLPVSGFLIWWWRK